MSENENFRETLQKKMIKWCKINMELYAIERGEQYVRKKFRF